jgi:hypothetical protein
MTRRLLMLAMGLAVLESSLLASAMLNVAFYPPSQVSCGSMLTTGADSETLTLGACTDGGPVTFMGQPFASAMAAPLEVAVDGLAGLESGTIESDLAIGASAEYSGAMEPVGGTGSAFLEFDVTAFGADSFLGDFSIAGEGIDFAVDTYTQRREFLIPITFGDPVGYSLSVAQSFYTWDEPDVMLAGLLIGNLEVVNADGVPIPGASVNTSAAPEPGSGGMLGAGVGMLVVGGWLRRRTCRKA